MNPVRIVPSLWFDCEAKSAAEFYSRLFQRSEIWRKARLRNTPSGSVDVLDACLAGQDFVLMNGGPLFEFNPSVSFLIRTRTPKEAGAIWKRLSKGGRPRMALGPYPFSDMYGWTRDRFGLDWQVMSTGGAPFRQKIIPTILFAGAVSGKAEEAVRFYTSVFKGSKIGKFTRYKKSDAPDRVGTVSHVGFSLSGQEFAAMDSARVPEASFSEAISFVIQCRNQQEIDYYWDKLSARPEAEQCGWLKDRYGLSWQVTPAILGKMLSQGSRAQVDRVTRAFLPMKKIDIAALKKAYKG